MTSPRYRVLGPLQSGEGSRAALGLQIGADGVPTPVVLIFAPPGVNADGTAAKQLAKDTERAVIVEHPHILRVHGLTVLEDQGTQSLARVTEFADGESLRRVLEVAKRLPPRMAALIVADASLGIHYAHLAGNDDGTPLVHGDIRPDTVMVCFSGISKASGYGALSVAPREANGRRVVNRRKYSAPEQVVSGRAAVIVQSDVFLLGLTLHECLAGRQPFANAEDHDQAILTEPLEPLRSDVPVELGAVVQKATAKKSGERFPSALAFREAIVDAVGGLPSHEELAAYLSQLFPDADGARSRRKNLIDAGIASYAKEVWSRATTQPETPAFATPPAAPEPVKVPPAPTKPSPAPAARAVQPTRPPGRRARVEEDDDAPPPRPPPSALKPILIGLGAAAVAIAAFMFLTADRTPAPQPTLAETVIDAGTGEDPSLAVAAPATDGVDAGAIAVAAVADVPPPLPVEVQSALLELNVEPPVSISINGEEQGKGPLKLNLKPGKYVVGLSDKAQGIRTSRTVVLPAGGTAQSIYLQKGFVSVAAPDGAEIFIDGRKVGTAPQKEISVFEGSHRILVRVGSAKWSQSFSVGANERMFFDVELNEP